MSDPLAVLRRLRDTEPLVQPRAGERCELCTEPIGDEHSHLVDVHAGRVRATVTSARPLDPALELRLKTALEKSSGKVVLLGAHQSKGGNQMRLRWRANTNMYSVRSQQGKIK